MSRTQVALVLAGIVVFAVAYSAFFMWVVSR